VLKQLIVQVLSISWLALTAPAMADTTLQRKFQKGEAHRQQMTFKRTIDRGTPNSQTENSENLEMEFVCDDVLPSGVASLRQRLRRVRISMTEPDETLKYDTNEGAPNDLTLQQMDRIIRPMIGADWSMQCDTRGKISRVVLPEMALNALKASPDAFGGKLFSEAGLKWIAEQAEISLPEKPVKPGDKWTTSNDVKAAFGTMNYQREYTFTGSDDKPGIEKIQVKVKIELKPDPDSKFPFIVKLISGSGSGDILFDNQLGRVARSHVKSKVVFEQSAPGVTRQLTFQTEETVERLAE
jgi:hypothetical protein